MLVTALLVSGAASATLLAEWNAFNRSTLVASSGLEADAATSVSFAGDPALVPYDTTTDEIDLYLLNSGSLTLDKDNIAVQVDGSPALVVSVAVLDSSTGAWQTSAAWGPGDLVRVTTEDGGSGWSYNDGDEVTLLVVCRSEPTRGVTGSDVVNEEVRLTHA